MTRLVPDGRGGEDEYLENGTWIAWYNYGKQDQIDRTTDAIAQRFATNLKSGLYDHNPTYKALVEGTLRDERPDLLI